MLGFAPASGDRSIWRHLVTLYERALLSSLHPAGAVRLRRGPRSEARRLWISREALLARFGTTPEKQASHLEKRSVVAQQSGKE